MGRIHSLKATKRPKRIDQEEESKYRKTIQDELDEEGDSETEEEMESQHKVIAELAKANDGNEGSSAQSVVPKEDMDAMLDRMMMTSRRCIFDQDCIDASGGGEGWRCCFGWPNLCCFREGWKQPISSAKSVVPKVDDADKDKYKRLIRKQLDEENEDETDEEMDANVKVVMQLAREAVAKKGKVNVVNDDDASDTDIESQVIDALRKAGKANPDGMSEKVLGEKIMEGLDALIARDGEE